MDQYPGTLSFLALTLAHLGYIDQAQSRIHEARLEARGHAHTLAHVLNFASWIDWLTGSPELPRHADELQTVSTEQDFPLWLGWAFAYRGRWLISQGQAAEGFALLSQGLAAVRATGAVVATPLLLIWQADAHGILGRPSEGLQCLAEAARIIETTGERCTETELHRLHGDLLNATGDRCGAERHYRLAIAVAERQSAKLLQLRASVGLARLWGNQGQQAEARELIVPIFDWFTEGFDTPDLKDARAMIKDLA
jgi:predicted ATPase